MVPAFCRTGHPFAVSGPRGPSQKIESVFSASPETVRRKPREFDLRRLLGQVQDLAACALRDPDVFLFVGSVFRPPPRCTLLQVQSPVVLDPPPSDMQPSCAQQQGLLDSCSLSSFRFHRPAPNRDRIGVPALLLPPGSSGYACCVVEKAGCVSLSPLISFHPRKARSN